MKLPESLEQKLRDLPRGAGVYLFMEKRRRVVYVGKAVDLRSRVRSYFSGDGPADRPRIKALLPAVVDLEVIRVKSEKEALLLENSLIKKHRPRGNVRLRDDKSYLCVRVDRRHDYPRITFVRKFQRDGAMYFGPYVDAQAVREAVRTIQAAYGLRTCSDHVLKTRRRPCLYHQMGQCSAPCTDAVDPGKYAESVGRALSALRGRPGGLIRDLEGVMRRHSDALEYERAAQVRDRIAAVRKTIERQGVSLPDLKARDVVHVSRRGEDLLFMVLFVREGKLLSSRHHFIRSDADYEEAMASFLAQFYSAGKAVPPEIMVSDEPESRALLEEWLTEERGGTVRIRVPQRGAGRDLIRIAAENSDAAARRGEAEVRSRTQFAVDALADRLHLDGPPTRIECFDISTIGGTATVASLVVFEEGLPDKASYRRYQIKTVSGQDDVASMREVLTRRVLRAEEMPLPDLMVVDGGPGQLSSALVALEEIGVVDVPLAGLAKARSGKSGRPGTSGKVAFERVYLPGRSDPVVFEPDAPETLLIARIRDEAHRFAIRYHRKVRSKLAMSSMLDRVEGVGETWRNRLLARFGSVAGIRKASLDELTMVPGLPRETARRIHEFLKADPGDLTSSADDPSRPSEGDET